MTFYGAHAFLRAPLASAEAGRSAGRRALSSTAYDFEAVTLGGGTRKAPVAGESISLSQYKGKVVLVENVAAF